jgi:hypothetical protein
MSLKSSRDHPLVAAIRSQNGPGNLVSPTSDRFENVFIDGTNPGGLGIGFQFALGPGGDRNNDFGFFLGCSVNNFTKAGWSFEHSQSVAHTLVRCHLNGYGVGRYGVTTALGPTGNGGNFAAYASSGAGNTGADFYLGSPNRTIVIDNFDSENSARLLDCAGSGSAGFPVTIRGARFASTRVAPDHFVVRYTYPGPLEISTSVFSGALGPPPLRVFVDAHGQPGTYMLAGNSFNDAGSAAANPLVCNNCQAARSAVQNNLFRGSDRRPAVHR